MLWKCLISSAFKTNINPLHPVLQCHMGQKVYSCCPYWEKRGHDLLLACIRIAPMPAVESLLNFYHHKERLKVFFSQCHLLFCRSPDSHYGDLNYFGAILPGDPLLTDCADCAYPAPRLGAEDVATKVHSFLLREELYTDVQMVRRPQQQLRHWLGAMKPRSFSHPLIRGGLGPPSSLPAHRSSQEQERQFTRAGFAFSAGGAKAYVAVSPARLSDVSFLDLQQGFGEQGEVPSEIL